MTTHTATPQIRRRRDGSIDTAHYLAEGRRQRSAAAHALLPEASAQTHRRSPLAALAAGIFGIGLF